MTKKKQFDNKRIAGWILVFRHLQSFVEGAACPEEMLQNQIYGLMQEALDHAMEKSVHFKEV